MWQKLFLASLTISITSIGIVGAANYYGENLKTAQQFRPATNTQPQQVVVAPIVKQITFPKVEINALGGYVGRVDLESGTITPIYLKNQHKSLPIASISKLVTAYVATQNRKLSDTFDITDWAISGPWPSHKFTVGDTYTLGELLKAALVESNNDAARVLASSIGERNFVQKMNTAAVGLSLTDTKLYSSDGTERMFSDTWVENTSTAEDIAHLIVNLYKTSPELLRVTTKQSVLVSDVTGTKTFTAYSTNRLMSYFSNNYTLLGGKTGTSDLERKHLVVLFQDNQGNAYVAVVLQSKDNFSDMTVLLDAITQYKQQLYAKS